MATAMQYVVEGKRLFELSFDFLSAESKDPRSRRLVLAPESVAEGHHSNWT
jgi:hypothetical protein